MTTYSQAFNLQVQYGVAPNTNAFAGYVGGNGKHIMSSFGANAVSSILLPTANLKSSRSSRTSLLAVTTSRAVRSTVFCGLLDEDCGWP